MQKKRLSFELFRQAHLEAILPDVERILRKYELDFYILGGLARDIQFLREGYLPSRITRDIDIAVFIPVSSIYEELLNAFTSAEKFVKVYGNPVRLRHQTGGIVDLLPFNSWTSSTQEMTQFSPALAGFNLKGLHEIFKSGTEEVIMEEDHRYQVTTLDAIVLLKFLAFNDKPEWRQKDMEDIGLILKKYFLFHDDEIYDYHSDLFSEDCELILISARVIGRKIGGTLAPNPELKNSILAYLEQAASRLDTLTINLLSKAIDLTPEEAMAILMALDQGIKDDYGRTRYPIAK